MIKKSILVALSLTIAYYAFSQQEKMGEFRGHITDIWDIVDHFVWPFLEVGLVMTDC